MVVVAAAHFALLFVAPCCATFATIIIVVVVGAGGRAQVQRAAVGRLTHGIAAGIAFPRRCWRIAHALLATHLTTLCARRCTAASLLATRLLLLHFVDGTQNGFQFAFLTRFWFVLFSSGR